MSSNTARELWLRSCAKSPGHMLLCFVCLGRRGIGVGPRVISLSDVRVIPANAFNLTIVLSIEKRCRSPRQKGAYPVRNGEANEEHFLQF
jgi:hypothetical protein